MNMVNIHCTGSRHKNCRHMEQQGYTPDGGDLLDDLGRGVQVDEALVDAHLEPAGHKISTSAGAKH